MRRLYIWLLALCVVLGMIGCMGAMKHYKKQPRPQYSGTINVPGLEGKVDVYRDDYGVPHIISDNAHDLYFATGYVQAQDRLWQMIFFRAIAEGRMCELFGNVGVPGMHAMGFELSTLSIDKRQRTMGMKYMGEISAAMLEETNPALFAQMQTYCDGVNAYIAEHTAANTLPLEFQALRVKPDPWQVSNMMSFGRFIGSLLSSNLPIELSRYAAIREFGEERGWELVPLFGHVGHSIVPTEILKNKLDTPRDLPPGGRPSQEEMGYSLPLSAEHAKALLLAERTFSRSLNMHGSFGSNSWLVSGKMTESGNVIVSNDPHLAHIQPSIFYLQHIKGPGIDSYGVTFAGNPYVVLGHNRDLAWASTTSRADVMDLFVETVDPKRPGMYKYKGEWLPFVEREEVIRIKSGPILRNKKIKIRQSVHGPIINDVEGHLPKGMAPVALRWTGWDVSRDTRAFDIAVDSTSAEQFVERYRALDDKFRSMNIMSAMDRLNRGESIEDFIAAVDMLVVPNQNWGAGDNQGRIIYLPGGLVPSRAKGLGVLPAPGESGEFDWTGHIPLMELPHMIDPDRGYVVTANNEVVEAEWYPHVFSTSSGEPWRAMRIQELLLELAPLDVDDMKRIQDDVYVRRAEWEVPIILAAVDKKQPTDPRVLTAVQELRNWDYEADLDCTATLIFYRFIEDLMRNILEDEAHDYTEYKLEGYADMAVNVWLEKRESSFFDDVRTKDKVEDMDDMIVKSLADTMKWIDKKYGPDPEDRRWGKVHWIKFYHVLGVFGEYQNLSVGPFPYVGGDQTVRNAKGIGFGKYPYKAFTGACLRHIVDMGEPDEAQIVIDGSQSGQYLSEHYDDMHKLFVDSGYITTVMDPDAVREQAKYHLELRP